MRNKNMALMGCILAVSIKSAFAMETEEQMFPESSGKQHVMPKKAAVDEVGSIAPTENLSKLIKFLQSHEAAESVKRDLQKPPLLLLEDLGKEVKDQTSPKMESLETSLESPTTDSPTTKSPKRKISKTLPVGPRRRNSGTPRVGGKNSGGSSTLSVSPTQGTGFPDRERKNSLGSPRKPDLSQEEQRNTSPVGQRIEILNSPGRMGQDREPSPGREQRNLLDASGSMESPGREGAVSPPRSRNNSQGTRKVSLQLSPEDVIMLNNIKQKLSETNLKSTLPPEEGKSSPKT